MRQYLELVDVHFSSLFTYCRKSKRLEGWFGGTVLKMAVQMGKEIMAWVAWHQTWVNVE